MRLINSLVNCPPTAHPPSRRPLRRFCLWHCMHGTAPHPAKSFPPPCQVCPPATSSRILRTAMIGGGHGGGRTSESVLHPRCDAQHRHVPAARPPARPPARHFNFQPKAPSRTQLLVLFHSVSPCLPSSHPSMQSMMRPPARPPALQPPSPATAMPGGHIMHACPVRLPPPPKPSPVPPKSHLPFTSPPSVPPFNVHPLQLQSPATAMASMVFEYVGAALPAARRPAPPARSPIVSEPNTKPSITIRVLLSFFSHPTCAPPSMQPMMPPLQPQLPVTAMAGGHGG